MFTFSQAWSLNLLALKIAREILEVSVLNTEHNQVCTPLVLSHSQAMFVCTAKVAKVAKVRANYLPVPSSSEVSQA